MPTTRFDPPVIAKAGRELSIEAGELTCLLNAFIGAAEIPPDAAGPVGPGRDALKAYENLLDRVVAHLRDLQDAVDETGQVLVESARSYAHVERINTLHAD